MYRVILLLLLCIALSVIGLAGPTFADSLFANDDAYTRQDEPDATHDDYGLWTGWFIPYYCFVEFTLGSTAVSTASLHMYHSQQYWWCAPQTIQLRGGEADIDETTLCWANQPDASTWPVLGQWVFDEWTTNGWPVSLDITDFYNTNLGKTVTLRLALTAYGYIADGCSAGFEDREETLATDYGWAPAGSAPRIDYQEVIPDNDPPSKPEVTVSMLCPRVTLNWNTCTDPTTSVIGYRVYRDGVLVQFVAAPTTTYTELGNEGETYVYTVASVDEGNNSTSSDPVNVPVPLCYAGNEVSFQFNDQGDAVYNYYTPGYAAWYFHTESEESPSYWIGTKSVIFDGMNRLDPSAGLNNWNYRFSDADGGSLIVRTETVEETGPRGFTYLDSSPFFKWYRWIAGGPDDAAEPEVRIGMSVETSFEILGDAYGWCFGGTWGGKVFPTIEPCTAMSDLRHQGSDWGGNAGAASTIRLCVARDRNLDAPGYDTPEGCYLADGEPDEWIQWDNVVTEAGQYRILQRWASATNQAWHYSLDGSPVGHFNTKTGGDSVWAVTGYDVPNEILVNVTAGPHTVRLNMSGSQGTGTGKVNWVQLTKTDGTHKVRLQVEDCDQAYDTTPGNSGDASCTNSKCPDVDLYYSSETSGWSDDGTEFWVAVMPNNVHDPLDDEIRINNHAGRVAARYTFKDGKGLGLVPEDGYNGTIRNGIIESLGNRLKLKVAAVNAGPNKSLVDIWVTRPDGEVIHINPVTCEFVSGEWEDAPAFGMLGHTHLAADENEAGFASMVSVGCMNWDTPWGVKYNWVKVRNDWDGEVQIQATRLGDLRVMPLGSYVVFSDDAERITITDVLSADSMPPYYFYIEEEDRSAGVKLIYTDWPAPIAQKGEKVTGLAGLMTLDSDGNRCLDITTGSFATSYTNKTIEPVGMSNLTVAGSDVSSGIGLGNTGMLATVWGRATDVQYDMYGNLVFDLNDGSGTPVKVRDLMYDGSLLYVGEGQYWAVTGAIAVESDGTGGYRRVVIAVSGNQIQ